LEKLGVDRIVAGDVYIEDHLRYMERLATSVGAELAEPLWGMDPAELLYREIEDGVEPLVIGSRRELSDWVGAVLDSGNVDRFVEAARRCGFDPLGERGEYHTIVLRGPLHRSRLGYSVLGVEVYGGYHILRVV